MTIEKSNELNYAQLDALFDQARQVTVAPSPDLMARILADAEAEMPKSVAEMPIEVTTRSGGFFSKILTQIGGVAGASGLAVATAAGLLIGTADFGLQDIAAQAVGLEIVDYDLSDLYPDFASAQEDL